MLFTAENVAAAVRTQEGKRVFWLSPEDRLTPAAQDWLRQEKIEITRRSGEFRDLLGGVYLQKPEEMTHLSGNVLVSKTHARIAFRGKVDELQAEVLLLGAQAEGWLRRDLEEMLEFLRKLLRAEVLEEPLGELRLLGLDGAQLREHSHYPQKYYGQAHFQPKCSDPAELLRCNALRTRIRETEIACCRAFSDGDGILSRRDLVQGLNRLSAACYLLMIRLKAEKEGTWNSSSNK